jgi:para-nitrobenzyl esterase
MIRRNREITKTDEEISYAITTYWTNLAEYGDPDGDVVLNWPAFSDTDAVVMCFKPTLHTDPVPGFESLRVAGFINMEPDSGCRRIGEKRESN